jgi:hypothetical protein
MQQKININVLNTFSFSQVVPFLFPSDCTMALGSTQPLVKMSTRNIPGGKCRQCVRMTSSTSRAECHEIWEPKPPGTLWTTPGLLRDTFTFYFYVCMYSIWRSEE